MDGYLKRQTKVVGLCGTGKRVPYRAAESKAVCGTASEAEVHVRRAKAHKGGGQTAAEAGGFHAEPAVCAG